ncbi:ankyrin repeat domain 18,19 [Tritrichomonas foetus]|uniref:Ankyrin repeat domain 18,19 n=1 Tax=Tritrichomonas foetus TaxID=1144522 RepID=A0A1J4KNJ3_9EUKA|nr:ankyrin repeat domain 18,19 [Tritrichomonas foetus]|eukprot:OHT11364.1 ankyrin repeat domain 18,19 [Tritrichomonas foetus]
MNIFLKFSYNMSRSMTEDSVADFNEIIDIQSQLFEIACDCDMHDFQSFYNNYKTNNQIFPRILRTINQIVKTRPSLLPKCKSFLSFLKDDIKSFIATSDLISLFSHNQAIMVYLYELELIDINVLIRKYNIFKFYFEEAFLGIKEKKMNNFMVYEHWLSNKYSNALIKENLENGMNDHIIAKFIQNDDDVSLHDYINQTNLDVDSFFLPSSVFETNFYLQKPKRKLNLINYSAFLGSIQVFKYLLMHNAKIDNYILHYSIAGGNTEIIHLLESKKIKLNNKCIKIAIKFHRNELVTYFHSNYEIEFTKDDLFESLRSYNFYCFNLILAEQENFLFQLSKRKNNIFAEAVEFNNIEIMQFVMDKVELSSKVNRKDIFCFVASNGYFEACQIMIKNPKISKNEVDHYHRNALHFAAENGHLDIVKLLINSNLFSVSCTAIYLEQPLHYSAEKGHLDVVQFLVNECFANGNCQTKSKMTPLHLACVNGHLEVVKFLISKDNININAIDIKFNTPLHLAISVKNVEIVKLLINHPNINLNARDHEGQTPLHSSILSDSVEIIDILVKKEGVDIKATMNKIESNIFMEFLLKLIIISFILQQLMIVLKPINT